MQKVYVVLDLGEPDVSDAFGPLRVAVCRDRTHANRIMNENPDTRCVTEVGLGNGLYEVQDKAL